MPDIANESLFCGNGTGTLVIADTACRTGTDQLGFLAFHDNRGAACCTGTAGSTDSGFNNILAQPTEGYLFFVLQTAFDPDNVLCHVIEFFLAFRIMEKVGFSIVIRGIWSIRRYFAFTYWINGHICFFLNFFNA
jgi:hypothetical protein